MRQETQTTLKSAQTDSVAGLVNSKYPRANYGYITVFPQANCSYQKSKIRNVSLKPQQIILFDYDKGHWNSFRFEI